MKYAQIRQFDVANGVGIRTTLFVSGCTFGCKNCFNSEYQDFNFGKDWTSDVENYFIDLAKNPLIDGVSILGGDPMMQDNSMGRLLKRIKGEVAKPVWMWTGYIFEEIPKNRREWLQHIDVLVDGRFLQEKHHHSLRFRGSSNQRIIDVKETIESGNITLYKL